MAEEIQSRQLDSPEARAHGSDSSGRASGHAFGRGGVSQEHSEIQSFDGGGARPPGLGSPVPQRSGAQVGGGWIEQFADAPDVLKSAAANLSPWLVLVRWKPSAS